MAPYDVMLAAVRGRQAMRRGNLAEAERWFKLADRAMIVAQRIAARAIAEEDAERRRVGVRNPR